MILAALALLASFTDSQITLVSPTERQVVQRDEHGSAPVDVVVRAPSSTKHLVAHVANADGAELSHVELAMQPGGGTTAGYAASIVLPGGGWYHIDVMLESGAAPTRVAGVDHFGVGEVFVIAGQSNSSNFGEELFPALDDLVSSYDGAHWALAQDPMPGTQDGAQGGSPWIVCGRALQNSLGVPVALASCGYGGTSLAQWQKGATMKHGDDTISLFSGLEQRVRALGKIRAILWHQGESDANGKMKSDEYVRLFKQMKDDLTRETGCSAPWMIAHATYVPGVAPEKLAAVRDAQSEIWKRGLALQGPDTDELLGAMRHSKDHIHFSKTGLEAHGTRWAALIFAQLFATPPLKQQ